MTSEKERLDTFYYIVKERLDAGELDNVQVHNDLATEAARLDVQQKATLVLAQLLFDASILQQVKNYRNLLLRFTHNDNKAQKYLIGGLQLIIALHKDELMDKVARILKLFYDNGILKEKAISEWASRVSTKYVCKEIATKIHENAKPFVQWLQDTSEELDTEVKYNDCAQVESMQKESSEKTNPLKKTHDEGDDLHYEKI